MHQHQHSIINCKIERLSFYSNNNKATFNNNMNSIYIYFRSQLLAFKGVCYFLLLFVSISSLTTQSNAFFIQHTTITTTITSPLSSSHHHSHNYHNTIMIRKSMTNDLSSNSIVTYSDDENKEKEEDNYNDNNNSMTLFSQNDDNDGPPSWMKCINAIAHKTGALNEIVSKAANVSLQQANFLIEIGAVWAKMDIVSEQDILNQYQDINSSSSYAKVQYADLQSPPQQFELNYDNEEEEDEVVDLESYIEQMESRRYNRVLSPTIIEQGTDVRIYPNPRRFKDACSEFESSTSLNEKKRNKRLLYEDTTFIIVDKPPMMPTQPDCSNYYECVPGCVQKYMGPFYSMANPNQPIPRPLICHRVDSCVGGCIVLSKDERGQRTFNKLQRDRKVKKVYLAVTKKEVPLGLHIHWMWAPLTRGRGNSMGPSCQLLSHEVPLNRKKAKNWTRCILEVVSCEPITIQKSDKHTYDPGSEQHYQSTIRLVTGRKHQVRAQLSSLGCPIIRDTLYEPVAGMTLDNLGGGEDGDDDMETAVDKCRIPTEPIGLQAHAILFGGVRAKANRPWWSE